MRPLYIAILLALVPLSLSSSVCDEGLSIVLLPFLTLLQLLVLPQNVRGGARRQQECLHCYIDFIEEEDVDDGYTLMCTTEASEESDGRGDMTYQIDLPEDFLSANMDEIMTGTAQICIPGGQAVRSVNGETDSMIIIPPGADIQMVGVSLFRRQLLSRGYGARKTLVVRAVGTDGGPDESRDLLAGAVFGIGPEPLENSMRAQFQRCSFGQIDFLPATGFPQIVNGIMDVNVGYRMNGKDISQMQDDIVEKTEDALGLNALSTEFDHVLFCIPPGVHKKGDSWLAYASRPGWKSFYLSKYCGGLSVLMHEIGHNIGLRHSGEGSKDYGDETGYVSRVVRQ